MATFSDAAGREWRLELTLGVLPRLRELGVDVGFAVASLDRVVEAAFRDPDTTGRVLWTLVEGQAEKSGVTPDQFADGMNGPAIASAVEAFADAILGFTHRPIPATAAREKLREQMTANDALLARAYSTLSVSAGDAPATPAVPTPAPSPTAS